MLSHPLVGKTDVLLYKQHFTHDYSSAETRDMLYIVTWLCHTVQFIIFSSNKIYVYAIPVGNDRIMVIVKNYGNICRFAFSSTSLEVFDESHVFDSEAVNIRDHFGTSCYK